MAALVIVMYLEMADLKEVCTKFCLNWRKMLRELEILHGTACGEQTARKPQLSGWFSRFKRGVPYAEDVGIS